jgi:hypothetical protein
LGSASAEPATSSKMGKSIKRKFPSFLIPVSPISQSVPGLFRTSPDFKGHLYDENYDIKGAKSRTKPEQNTNPV